MHPYVNFRAMMFQRYLNIYFVYIAAIFVQLGKMETIMELFCRRDTININDNREYY